MVRRVKVSLRSRTLTVHAARSNDLTLMDSSVCDQLPLFAQVVDATSIPVLRARCSIAVCSRW